MGNKPPSTQSKAGRVTVRRTSCARSVLLDQKGRTLATLFANADVPVDAASVSDAHAFSGISERVSSMVSTRHLPDGAGVLGVALTPDFHRGSGVPVGTVMASRGIVFPRSPGGDIGCGVSLVVTDVRASTVDWDDPAIVTSLRSVFFGGRRDIPTTPQVRQGILLHGLAALDGVEKLGGLWRGLDGDAVTAAAAASDAGGSHPARGVEMFADWLRGSGDGMSHDNQLGSLSGGNHFLEMGVVDGISDRHVAWDWGLSEGMVTILVHNGSVGFGGMVGDRGCRSAFDLCRSSGLPAGEDGFHPLPLAGEYGHLGRAYLDGMGMAANFAAVNRLLLGRMALAALGQALGREVGGNLLWDAPHNLAWRDPSGDAEGLDGMVHRKGASPAFGESLDMPWGMPVLIPGSMGDSSWVMRGLGLADAWSSAPHGAGRVLSRGAGRHAGAQLQKQTDERMQQLRTGVGDDASAKLRVVGPADMSRMRGDVVKALLASRAEEAPRTYKPVGPVVDSTCEAGMAARVARLRPLVTVKS